MSGNATPKILVDDPFDAAVARYERKAAVSIPTDTIPVPSTEAELRERILRLENTLQATLDSLNAATITCSGGSVVLTLPSLPT